MNDPDKPPTPPWIASAKSIRDLLANPTFHTHKDFMVSRQHLTNLVFFVESQPAREARSLTNSILRECVMRFAAVAQTHMMYGTEDIRESCDRARDIVDEMIRRGWLEWEGSQAEEDPLE